MSKALVSAVMAAIVALPLANWAAARVPPVAAVSFTSSNRRTTTAHVHRRMRRNRRRRFTRRVSLSRAHSTHVYIPKLRFPPAVLSRSSMPTGVDLPPPDHPPA
jgi:hypothetical protein